MLLEAASIKQTDIAKEILGLRTSTDHAGVLTEIGWTNLETKATKARLLFWWRLGRTDSRLMRKLERQAHTRQNNEIEKSCASDYNWWRSTDALVQRIAHVTEMSPTLLRAFNKDTFRRIISNALWTEEYNKRLEACKASSRLQLITAELLQMAEEDEKKNTSITGINFPLMYTTFHFKL